MAGWFRKPDAVPRRQFRPSDLTYPFAFPVVTIDDAGDVAVFRSAERFGMINESSMRDGRAPKLEVFTSEMRIWTPLRVVAGCETDIRLFGRRIFYGEFEYAAGPEFELPDLKARVVACVRADPDDLWNQVAEHDDVIKAVTRGGSFTEVAKAIAEVGGRGW